jgi:hypothetical protein
MKKLWKVLAACALTSPLGLAAQEPAAPASEHEQHVQQEQHAAPPDEVATDEHSMAAMHEHMRKMREQMARIHATDNADERQRLMREHMQSMQEHMNMMGAMHGQKPAAGPSRRAEGEAPAPTR